MKKMSGNAGNVRTCPEKMCYNGIVKNVYREDALRESAFGFQGAFFISRGRQVAV